MKSTKLFLGEKRLKDIYVGATKWQVFKFKTYRLIRRVFIVAFIIQAIGWTAVGGFYYAKSNIAPVTVWAERTVEVPIRTKFEDIPMLVKICKAESGLRQFNSKGDVLRGIVNHSDIGYCQINEYINNDLARKLGYDIFTEQGNKDFAVYLYMNRGVQPWMSSSKVWNK